MHPAEQPGSAVRAMPCGLEPHQYDLHEHLFRGRHAGYIPLGRRMGALRLAGRRGCRSAALRRLAVAHAPQRKIASAQSCPVRSAAVFRPYTRIPSQPAAGASAYPGRKPYRFCRCVRMISSLQLQPPLAPVLRPGMPPGLSATESQNRFRTRLPLHRTLPAPVSPPIPPDAPIRCRPRRPELPENGLRKIQTVLFIN